jgi:O-methyltransferase involved in polyketide biosynthesis
MDITTLRGIPETMLIPLWARAVESGSADPIIKDRKAVEVVSCLPYDFSRFNGVRLSRVGVCVRTMLIDGAVRRFLKRNPDGVVINLGAGLDTRHERLAVDGVRWYDLDVRDAIALRREFFSESDTYHFIAKSVFDYSWMDDVGDISDPVLFVAEGLLMYFSENEVKSLVNELATRFPGAEMLVEVLAPLLVGRSRHHDSLSKIGDRVEFKWGPKDCRKMEAWHDGIRFIEEWNYFDYHRKRWGWFGCVGRLPVIGQYVSNRIALFSFERTGTNRIQRDL